jgi:hypothetical protein
MKGIKLQTTLNGDESVGLWFGTNSGTHWSGISGQRTINSAGTAVDGWATDLRFYTHEQAAANLTYARERMRIDSAGIVTKPYQPAFRASGNGSWQALLGNVQAPFNVAPVNIGGHYSTSNKRFTAPVAGQYYFTWHTYNDNAYSNAIVPRVNGTGLTGGGGDSIVAFSASGVTGNLTISASIVLTLAANDYVDLACRGNHSSKIYMGHSQFSGYLIG